ncbi:hypothetical protein [Pleionea sediminis]|uniref:type III secretion apparatus assembly protein SctX n=1 Tax=Pleionea sediminis TaxID=2569479 RepID=UPI0011869576|nr:hypothetical protein [Pleionea sediminis]
MTNLIPSGISRDSDFQFGLSQISHFESIDTPEYHAPLQNRLLFNGEVQRSRLSQIFERDKGEQLVNKVCCPDQSDYRKLMDAKSDHQAVEVLTWLESLKESVPDDLKTSAKSILEELASLAVQQRVQKNLLVSA